MKALVKFQSGIGNVEIRDVPEPKPAGNQVLLEVAWCGICGTDLHVLADGFRNFPPVILGHEFCGRVVEVGGNGHHVQVGERFAVLGASAVTCGQCEYCRKGEFMFCRQRRGMGHGVNGAFTRYAVARPDQLFRLPEQVPDEDGALCEPFAAAVHAVCDVTELRLGDVALISGPGSMGLLCLKLLVANGIKTIVAGAASDTLRLEKAKHIGAALVVDVTRQDLMAVVKEETGGRGVDVAFECAGVAASAQACLEALRPLGRYTQVGHFCQDVTVPFDHVAFKQLLIKGSVAYTAETWDHMLKILAAGKVRLGDLVTHKLPLTEWRKGFDLCERREALKVLLKP